MSRLRRLGVILACALLVAACTRCASGGGGAARADEAIAADSSADSPAEAASTPADLVVRGARIVRAAGLDEADRFATAMAIRGERIVYVGDDAGVAAHVGPATDIVDLRGAVVLPGLHDVHQHTLESKLDVIDCVVESDEVDAEIWGDTVARCGVAAETGWVLGWGYDVITLLEAERTPRAILDDAQPDRAAAIMSRTSHSTWVNSRALERLGIGPDTPDPPGGIIARDDRGRATGLLIDAAGEWPWEDALAASDAMHARNVAALERGLAGNARHGITSAVDARTYLERGYLRAYEALAARGALTTRMVLSLWASPLADDAPQLERLAARFADDGGRLRIRQIKLYVDGLLENTTAALLEPYATAEVFGARTGLNYFDPARLRRYLEHLAPKGFDLHIHAIGDRAVREALDAIEAARAAAPRARHRLTHVELIAPDDVSRFAALGVGADLQLGEHTAPGHREVFDDLIGRARTEERAWLLGSLFRAGVKVALSSDHDVGDLHAFASMARSLQLGAESLPSFDAALAAYTTHAAWIMGSEEHTGSLTTGRFGDFIVVDRDPYAIAPASLAETRVLWTVVGGATVYRSPDLPAASDPAP